MHFSLSPRHSNRDTPFALDTRPSTLVPFRISILEISDFDRCLSAIKMNSDYLVQRRKGRQGKTERKIFSACFAS